jgi:glycine cleavage system H protein
VNDALSGTPESINNDPYGDGWLVRVKLSDAAEVDGLLDVAAYRELLSQ